MLQDFQMARSHNDGSLNLAVGEPYFLQDAFNDILFTTPSVGDITYPLTDGQPDLIKRLKEMYNDKYVVVTHGAKYGLLAAFYAYKEVYMRSSVTHQIPYWPSYPTLAKLAGLGFNTGNREIKVVTTPNNPDCKEYDGECDIWDAAYSNQRIYRGSVIPKHEVAVYSGSKAYGVSGLRIGWVVTENKDLYNAMSQFMEITTSGVSVASQWHVAHILQEAYIEKGYWHMCEMNALKILDDNANKFDKNLASYCSEIGGLPVTKKGMFGWFKVKDPELFKQALVESNVKLVTGEACGMLEPGWFRMNLGYKPNIVSGATYRLSNYLYEHTTSCR